MWGTIFTQLQSGAFSLQKDNVDVGDAFRPIEAMDGSEFVIFLPKRNGIRFRLHSIFSIVTELCAFTYNTDIIGIKILEGGWLYMLGGVEKEVSFSFVVRFFFFEGI